MRRAHLDRLSMGDGDERALVSLGTMSHRQVEAAVLVERQNLVVAVFQAVYCLVLLQCN